MVDIIKLLSNTDKIIFYKKGRYAKPQPVPDKKTAIELWNNCQDGAVMEYPEKVEIWDYNEIDWLS